MLKRSTRALCYDPLHNFEPGIILTDQAELYYYLQRVSRLPFRILYRPRCDLVREVLAAEANYLCRCARAFPGVEIFLDELDSFASSNSVPDELSKLISFGRNIEVTLHCAVRRPKAVLPRHYVTETTQMSVFRMNDPEDIGFVEDFTHLQREQIERQPDLFFWSWRDRVPANEQFRLRFNGETTTIEAVG
jgi:hypothetical protein